MIPPDSPNPQRHGDGSFATTRWSLISGIRGFTSGGDLTPESQRALNELCRIYWYPLYCYIRRDGNGREDAEDLVQGYFHAMIEKKIFSKADSAIGKLRQFLLGTLKDFLIDKKRHKHALKRGGAIEFVPIETTDAEVRYSHEPVDLESPDQLYDRRWALMILERPVVIVGERWRLLKKGEIFSKLTPYLQEERLDAADSERIAGELGMSANNLRVIRTRLRVELREALKAEIAQTVNSEEQIDEEFRALRAALR